MKSKGQEKIFPTFRPTGGCVSLGAAQLCFETSFRRFGRTRLEGVSLPRGVSSLEAFVARQETRKALPRVPGEGVKCWTRFSGRSTTDCLVEVRQRSIVT